MIFVHKSKERMTGLGRVSRVSPVQTAMRYCTRDGLRDSIVGGAKLNQRENLRSDAKGKGASGLNREAESTDAPARGGGAFDYADFYLSR